MNRQKGFNLIELMIVVAIIGLLAGIAIPAYGDYIVRTRLTEVVNTLGKISTDINEHYAAMGVVRLPDSAAAIAQLTVLDNVSTATVTDLPGSVEMLLTMKNTGNSDVDGKHWKISFTVSAGRVVMSCTNGAANSFPSKFLPHTCR